MESSRGS